MRVAFVARELYPLGGGGIGVQVAGACAALADVAEVTVVTSSQHEPVHRQRVAAGEASVPPNVRLAFVDEPAPDEVGSYYGAHHLYSARVWDRLRELFPGGGPELIEFSDYMAEGLVTIQARRGHDPLLRDTAVCVRLHTSAEICSVLDGHLDDAFGTRMVVAAERYALRQADRVIAPAAGVLDTYARFYADSVALPALAPAVTIPPVVPTDPVAPAPPPPAEEIRFLYLGRLERRKGVEQLVRAFTGLREEGWRLTIAGGDTDTAPLGSSMRALLDLAAAGHPRIELLDELPRERVGDLIDSHHVTIVPSLWECWPSVVLESLARNRPVLATPTGGLPAMLGDDEGAGWLAAGVGAEPLADAVEALLGEPRRVLDAIASSGPLRAHRRLADLDRLHDSYVALAESASTHAGRRAAREPSDPPPLVSVVVPYFQLHGFVEQTVASVFDQDYGTIETVVVNDGSLREEDAILDELANRFPIRLLTQENGGLSAARNAGVLHSRGRYVLPLDADNVLDPSFVSRCVDLLEREPEIAFATTWLRWVTEDGRELGGPEVGVQPIGNSVAAVIEDNLAGDGTALIRREVFDRGFRYSTGLASYEDWQLYRELHRAGLYGAVIPERLLIYRLRPDSMVREIGLPYHGRLFAEMQARLREGEVQWVSEDTRTPIAS